MPSHIDTLPSAAQLAPLPGTLRGADIVARTLERLGVDRIFSLSGNHIMPLYDTLLDTRIEIVHVVMNQLACTWLTRMRG